MAKPRGVPSGGLAVLIWYIDVAASLDQYLYTGKVIWSIADCRVMQWCPEVILFKLASGTHCYQHTYLVGSILATTIRSTFLDQ
jgi:hypothetical protein